jgi:hypothetical protein
LKNTSFVNIREKIANEKSELKKDKNYENQNIMSLG